MIADSAMIEAAVQRACHAPSFHNSQPWRWVADEAGLQLFLDRDRRVRTDRSGRQALISCGAVLDHLRVAMAVLGWRAHAERFPHQADREQLASITLTPQDVASPAQRLRAERYRVAARIGFPSRRPLTGIRSNRCCGGSWTTPPVR